MEERNEEMEIDLCVLIWNFFKGLKKTWWLIPVLALLGGIAGYMQSSVFYTPMYRCEATFTVMTGNQNSDTGTESYNFYYDTSTAGQLAKTFPYILSSNLLTDAIKADLNVENVNGSLSAQAISDSNMITMSCVSTSPTEAKRVLESAIRVYPDVARFVIGNTRFNMIDVPVEPKSPYNQPVYSRKTEKWALAGAGAAVLFIVLFALMKKTVQKPDELKAVMNLTCLGNIPQVKNKARFGKKEVILSLFNSRTPQNFKESIKSLQVRIDREMENYGVRVLLVTSTAAGEGKTVIASNLAYAAALQGKKVLFIDGDLRKTEQAPDTTDGPVKGLEDVLFDRCSLAAALKKDEKRDLWTLSAGHVSSNIPVILNHPKMKELIDSCSRLMDLVIIDAPPCGLFEDAGILSEYADCILYIIRHDYIQRRRVIEGISELEDSHGTILGYAFNDIPVHRGGSGYYGYGRYGYGYYGYGRYGYGKYGEGYGEGTENKKQHETDIQNGNNLKVDIQNENDHKGDIQNLD